MGCVTPTACLALSSAHVSSFPPLPSPVVFSLRLPSPPFSLPLPPSPCFLDPAKQRDGHFPCIRQRHYIGSRVSHSSPRYAVNRYNLNSFGFEDILISHQPQCLLLYSSMLDSRPFRRTANPPRPSYRPSPRVSTFASPPLLPWCRQY